MQRTILTPAALPVAALGELKDWLAITTGGEDAPLTRLLHAALGLCEGFTGHLPLETQCEELLPASAAWQTLATHPVQAVVAVDAVAADGTRSPLPVTDYAVDLTADGGARVRVLRPFAARRIAVRFSAGMASGWAALPDAIRHGTIRLAAELYRDRTEASSTRTPPTAVVALWRPWRRLRLA
jgi:uncharacterized phiE125 gp8 family phage protein